MFTRSKLAAFGMIMTLLVVNSYAFTTKKEEREVATYPLIQLKELNAGDILVCEADWNSYISKVISFLTSSRFSHIAMVYAVNETNPDLNSLVDAGASEARPIKTSYLDEKRNVYVKRMLPKTKNIEIIENKIISTATEYMDKGVPYNMNELYTLGLLLVYKKFTLNTFTQKILIKYFKKLCTFIKDKNYPENMKPVTCAQFVYDCYFTSGYQLLVDIILQNANDNRENLLHLALKAPSKPQHLLHSNVTTESFEELAQELLKEVELEKNILKNSDQVAIDPELVYQINEFGNLMSTPLHNNVSTTHGGLLNLLEKSEKEHFVTPVDIFYTRNTEIVGLLK